MEIKIAIASNINFADKTLPIIINSLKESGVSNHRIYAFITGHMIESVEVIDDIHYVYVNHNSYECSALISIVENKFTSDYWFLIHDTCKVGKNFNNLLSSNLNGEFYEKVALTVRPSMCIGLYKYDYLITIKDSILNLKNQDYSEETLIKLKTWFIDNEDLIMWRTEPLPKLPANHIMQVIGYENWFGTETRRKTEYFPSFDIYKNKSNWGQSHTVTNKI